MPASPTDMTLVRADGGPLGAATATVSACRAAGIPCLLSLYAPWDVRAYNDVFLSATLERDLTDNIVALIETYGFDGVDFDWECDVQSNLDVAAYSQYFIDLDGVLRPMGKIMGMAAAPSKVVLTPEAANLFEYVGVMAYDVGSPAQWYGSYSAVQGYLDTWAAAGIARSKLVLGINFAARNCTGGGWYSYNWIVDTYDPAPDLNQVSGYCYNGIDLVTAKASYVADNGFGGVFVYTVNLDKQGDPRSLLRHINDTFGRP